MDISSISSAIPQTAMPTPAAGSRAGTGVPFSQMVSQFLEQTNAQQKTVDHHVQQMMAGEAENLQDIALSIAQADIAFRLAMEVRDQLITAYQEIMRMQV